MSYVVDTAYTSWGVAKPGIPKTKPTKILKHDCHKLNILTINQLQSIIHSLQSGPKSEYQEYWFQIYIDHFEQRLTKGPEMNYKLIPASTPPNHCKYVWTHHEGVTQFGHYQIGDSVDGKKHNNWYNSKGQPIEVTYYQDVS